MGLQCGQFPIQHWKTLKGGYPLWSWCNLRKSQQLEDLVGFKQANTLFKMGASRCLFLKRAKKTTKPGETSSGLMFCFEKEKRVHSSVSTWLSVVKCRTLVPGERNMKSQSRTGFRTPQPAVRMLHCFLKGSSWAFRSAQLFSSGSSGAGYPLVLLWRGWNTAVNCQQFANYGGQLGPLGKVHSIEDPTILRVHLSRF